MQLSIELLPAPLGPMMARISCSRDVEADVGERLDAAEREEMFSTSRMTSPTLARARRHRGSAPPSVSGRGLQGACASRDLQRRRSTHAACGRPRTSPAVSMYCVARAAVERVDQHARSCSAMKPRRTLRVRVSSPSSASSSLCRIRKRRICAPASAASAARSALTFSTQSCDQLVDLGLLRQVGVAGVGRLRRSAQLPTASMSMLMNAQTQSRPSPNATASLMYGKNLSLFSMYLGANSAPSLAPAMRPTSLARSMILQVAARVEEAGVAGVVPAVGRLALRRSPPGSCSTP